MSKSKKSFYRKLLLAHFIDNNINTVPKIMKEIDIPRRTAQDAISGLKDIEITCFFKGALKDGVYIIESWGGISPEWVSDNLVKIKLELNY